MGADLTSVQFAVLSLLGREPELDQRTLANRVSLDTSTLADVCRRLEQRGLLTRARDAEDARRYVLRITDGGSNLVSQVSPAVVLVGDALLQGFGAIEREALLALLRRLA